MEQVSISLHHRRDERMRQERKSIGTGGRLAVAATLVAAEAPVAGRGELGPALPKGSQYWPLFGTRPGKARGASSGSSPASSSSRHARQHQFWESPRFEQEQIYPPMPWMSESTLLCSHKPQPLAYPALPFAAIGVSNQFQAWLPSTATPLPVMCGQKVPLRELPDGGKRKDSKHPAKAETRPLEPDLWCRLESVAFPPKMTFGAWSGFPIDICRKQPTYADRCDNGHVAISSDLEKPSQSWSTLPACTEIHHRQWVSCSWFCFYLHATCVCRSVGTSSATLSKLGSKSTDSLFLSTLPFRTVANYSLEFGRLRSRSA